MTEIEKIVMAHRYLYYVKCEPIISDYEYDMLEKEALKTASEDSPLRRCGSSLESSYSQDIKTIAQSLR